MAVVQGEKEEGAKEKEAMVAKAGAEQTEAEEERQGEVARAQDVPAELALVEVTHEENYAC